MILSDAWIKEQCLGQGPYAMIQPFVPEQVAQGEDGGRLVSYGLGSYGYDLRGLPRADLAREVSGGIYDPKGNPSGFFEHIEGECVVVPPGTFALVETLEYLRMPGDVFGLFLGKSTYARAGLHVLATPAEPGWEGTVTLELANLAPYPIKAYLTEGLAQICFFKGERSPQVSYAGRQYAKYQGQRGITQGRV